MYVLAEMNFSYWQWHYCDTSMKQLKPKFYGSLNNRPMPAYSLSISYT